MVAVHGHSRKARRRLDERSRSSWGCRAWRAAWSVLSHMVRGARGCPRAWLIARGPRATLLVVIRCLLRLYGLLERGRHNLSEQLPHGLNIRQQQRRVRRILPFAVSLKHAHVVQDVGQVPVGVGHGLTDVKKGIMLHQCLSSLVGRTGA